MEARPREAEAHRDLPSGDVTFLMTDVEDSTALLRDAGPAGYAGTVATLRALLGAAAARNAGTLVDSEGDGALLAFTDPRDAIVAAVEVQDAINHHAWTARRPKVRMGLHRGEAAVEGGLYASLALHRTARVAMAPHGGQIVCSADVLAGAGEVGGVVTPLLGAYWIRDFPEPLALHQVQTEDALATFPSLRVPRADLTNVSAPDGELVGRDDLLDDLLDTVRRDRLVTLIGPGGVGKTRLALEAANRLASDGQSAWLVELATVEVQEDDTADAIERRVVAALARALGIASESPDAVLARLATRSVVVVLDNCEHVLDATFALVEQVLRRCPEAHVLATSREPLNHSAETLVTVHPLPVPPPTASLDLVAASPAVQLFVGRAQRANPAFRLDPATAEAIVTICRELDGLPLALELAGPSTRYLSATEMATRLRNVGSLPMRVQRDREARHRTLDAVVGWSLDACTEQQLTVFDALGAFARPAEAEAVAVVCADSGLTAGEVQAALEELVDKHLVVARTEDDVTQLDMLVTLRRVARNRLDERGESARMLERHARWVATAADEVERSGSSTHGDRWAGLVGEVVLVLERADRLGLDTHTWVSLLCSRVLMVGVRMPTLLADHAQVLLPRPDLSAPDRARILTVQAQSLSHGGAGDVDAALAAARAADSPVDLIKALVSKASRPGSEIVGTVDVAGGRAELSAELIEAQTLLPRVPDHRRSDVEAVLFTELGVELTQMRKLTDAREAHSRARATTAAHNDTFNEAISTFNIAEVDEMLGDLDAAVRGYADAAEMFGAHEYHLHRAHARMAGAKVHTALGQLDAAADADADAVLAARRSALGPLLGVALLAQARTALARGDRHFARASAAEVSAVSSVATQVSAAEALLADVVRAASSELA